MVGPKGPNSGLRSRFGFLSEKLAKLDGAWLPLLLLNGTSVATGTRIIASDLISTRAAPGGDGRPPGRFSIYPAAFDAFEMLSKPCPQAQVQGESCKAAHDRMVDAPNARAGADMRLSTAAMLSARFPIISPAGILRAEGDAKTGDRVVDDGYFENAGLTTAMDVARELRRLGVVPVVLWVQNGPRTDAGDPVPSGGQAIPPVADASPSKIPPRGAGTPELNSSDPEGFERVFGVVVTPVVALSVTRDGHGAEEAADAQRELWQLNHDVEPDHPNELLHVRHVREPEIQTGRRAAAADRRLRCARGKLAGRNRPDERSIDELVALPVGAGRTRFPDLRPAQPADAGGPREPPVAALPGQAARSVERPAGACAAGRIVAQVPGVTFTTGLGRSRGDLRPAGDRRSRRSRRRLADRRANHRPRIRRPHAARLRKTGRARVRRVCRPARIRLGPGRHGCVKTGRSPR